MSLTSYADVFQIGPPDSADEIRVGDLVRSGTNHHPHYEVLAIHGDKAWVRDVQTGADHLALLARCRKVAGPEA